MPEEPSLDDADSIIAFQRFLDQVEVELAAFGAEETERELVRILYSAGFHNDARKRAPDGVEFPDYPCCYRCLTARHGDECDGGDCECDCRSVPLGQPVADLDQ